MKLLSFCAAAAVASALSVSAPASAQTTTVSFVLSADGATVADGSFSYAGNQSGVLNYSNLKSFSFFDGYHSFDLSYVIGNQAAGSEYNYLGYDVDTHSFVETETNGYTYYITSIAPDYSTGFYTDSGDPAGNNPGFKFVEDYAAGMVTTPYDTISVISSTTSVPEPATWAMMLVGFGMMGVGLRYRRKSTTARFA